jgi:VWFA-related protein
MLSRRHLLRSAASCLPFLSHAQQELPTFSTDVKVVNVLATVTAKNGEILHDLTQDDFLVAEDNRPQTIKYFSRQTDLPLTLGLMIDTSMSQRRILVSERAASFRFLEDVLRPIKDHVFLLQFDFRIFFRLPLTNSLRDLNDALLQVNTPTMDQLKIQSGGGTLLYDAVLLASQDVMSKQEGRKALILLTDGVDTGSNTPIAEAIDAAQRADTLIYSILFSDPGAYGFLGGGPDGRRGLTRMSQETGGGFFEVSKKRDIDQIYNLIQDELRSQYNIGYVSDKPVTLPGFRRIQLTTKRKGLMVQSRDRYWARR